LSIENLFLDQAKADSRREIKPYLIAKIYSRAGGINSALVGEIWCGPQIDPVRS
jgi:hypothetical protein